jgi:hypothetical protein
MGKEATQFKAGNPGKPKGAKNKVSIEAKQLLKTILEGEFEHIQEALDQIRKKDKFKYLELLSKYLPYVVPKKLEVDAPTSMTINVKRRS